MSPLSSNRHGLFALLAWALCSALYFWTANGVVIKESDRNNAWHHYEYMVDGFLSGHLYLSLPPPKELLALPDPYDPTQNIRYRLWDVSLYQGKYYLYYGPTPALLVMLPWKVVTGHHLPQRLATGIFAVAGLGAIALLFLGVRRRYLPTASAAHLFWAIVVAGHLSWLPVILRRPAFWELPIVTAAALFWWSLFCLWKYHEGSGRMRWAIAAGTALAFALGARPTYLFAAGLVALLFALPLDRRLPLSRYLRRLLPVVTPLALGCAALLAYNYGRFGQFFEFGQRYQLWGMDERGVQHFSLSYLPFNLWLYFLSVPELSPYFPFFRTVWPGELPAGYIATEEIHGLLFAMPALLLGFVAWFQLWNRRADATWHGLRALLVAASGASLLAGSILCCFAGACSRYITELMAGWSVVGGIGFLMLFTDGFVVRRVALLRWLARFAVGWTLIYVWLASFEFRAFARMTQPDFYHAVAEVLNYPSQWIARRSGQVYGPLALDVHLAEGQTGTAVLLAAGRPGMMNQLTIERITPDEFRFHLVVNDLTIAETPVLHAGQRGVLHLECDAPWLYPPAAHPYWNAYPSPRERLWRQTLFGLGIDGQWFARNSIWTFDAASFEPVVRTAESRPTACAWVEKMHRLPPDPDRADNPIPKTQPAQSP